MVSRTEYLGSADAASLVSLEPYGCRRALVYKKSGVQVDDAERHRERFDSNEGPVTRGIELEPLIRARIAKLIGPCAEWRAPLIEQMMPPRPPVPAWLGATPDGIVGPLDADAVGRLAYWLRVKDTARIGLLTNRAGILEGKTVQQADLWRIRKQGPRQDHLLQVMHQMAATAAPWALLVYLNADQWRWSYHFIERDEAWEKETYLPAAYSSWEQITRAKSGINPADSPDLWEPFLPARLKEGSKQCRTCDHRRTCWGSAYASVMEIPVDGDAANMGDDPAWAAAVADYQGASEVLAECEAIKDDAAERIKALMGDRPVAEGSGARVYFKPQVSRRLDTKALQRDLPEIAAKYTKDSTSRPLRIYTV